MSVEERATAVRMRRLSGSAKLLILLAFLATTATVYFVLRGQTEESPVYSARATVSHPALAPVGDGRQASSPALSGVDGVKAAVIDEANLRPLLADLAGIEPQSVSEAEVDELRRRLRIDVDMPGGGQSVEVTLCYQHPDADRAAAVVDRLAETYATLCRRTLQAPVRQSHEVAARDAEEARQRYRQAQQGLVQFLEEHFDRHAGFSEGQVDPTAGLSRGWSSAPIVRPARFGWHRSQVRMASDEVPLVDNPEWLDLNDRLEKLVEQRRQLLVNLMPAHPRVRQVDEEIDRLETLLRNVPERIPDRHAPAVSAPPPIAPEIKPPVNEPPPEPPTVAPQQGPDLPLPSQPPGFSPEEHAQAVRDYRQLAAAADRAEQDYFGSIQQERTALAAMVAPAPVTCRFSAPVASLTGGMMSANVVAAALLAGLAAAVGLAMVLLAQSHRETFASVEEAAAVLPVPVVGTIPAGEASSRLEQTRRSPLAGALTAGGVTLVLVCAGIIALALNR